MLREHPLKYRKAWTKLNQRNRIAQKFDFYVPLCDGIYQDLVGGLEPSTITGTSRTFNPKAGKATELADTDHIIYGDVHDLGSESFTIGMWFRTTQNIGGGVISKASYSAANGRYGFYIDPGVIGFQFDDGANYPAEVSNSWNDDRWHFAVAVLDRVNTTNTLYINGIQQAQNSGFSSSYSWDTAFDLILGAWGDTDGIGAHATYDYAGGLSDVFICHEALSAAEILSLYRDFGQIWEPILQPINVNVVAAPSGRIMSSLARHGGLAGHGGIAGKGGGLAG